jgi:hypothetical protein
MVNSVSASEWSCETYTFGLIQLFRQYENQEGVEWLRMNSEKLFYGSSGDPFVLPLYCGTKTKPNICTASLITTYHISQPSVFQHIWARLVCGQQHGWVSVSIADRQWMILTTEPDHHLQYMFPLVQQSMRIEFQPSYERLRLSRPVWYVLFHHTLFFSFGFIRNTC